MGDDELNFTDEEARAWADDPKNQAQEWCAAGRVFAVSIALAAFVLLLIWLLSFSSQQPPREGAAAVSSVELVPQLARETGRACPERRPSLERRIRRWL